MSWSLPVVCHRNASPPNKFLFSFSPNGSLKVPSGRFDRLFTGFRSGFFIPVFLGQEPLAGKPLHLAVPTFTLSGRISLFSGVKSAPADGVRLRALPGTSGVWIESNY